MRIGLSVRVRRTEDRRGQRGDECGPTNGTSHRYTPSTWKSRARFPCRRLTIEYTDHVYCLYQNQRECEIYSFDQRVVNQFSLTRNTNIPGQYSINIPV